MSAAIIQGELQRIASRQDVTSYEWVSKLEGVDVTGPHDYRLFTMLDEVNQAECASGRPMLTAIVLNQETNIPGEGFFDCAKKLNRYEGGDDLTFWIREIARVHTYWQPPEGGTVPQ